MWEGTLSQGCFLKAVLKNHFASESSESFGHLKKKKKKLISGLHSKSPESEPLEWNPKVYFPKISSKVSFRQNEI